MNNLPVVWLRKEPGRAGGLDCVAYELRKDGTSFSRARWYDVPAHFNPPSVTINGQSYRVAGWLDHMGKPVNDPSAAFIAWIEAKRDACSDPTARDWLTRFLGNVYKACAM